MLFAFSRRRGGRRLCVRHSSMPALPAVLLATVLFAGCSREDLRVYDAPKDTALRAAEMDPVEALRHE